MRRIALSVFAVIALLFTASMSASASNHNCGDYVSQAAAQSVYDADTSDPKGLDGPPGPTSAGEPGVACEDYDYASNPGTNPGLLGGGNGNGDDGDNGDDDGDNGDGDGTTLPATGSGSMSVASSAASVLGVLASLLLVAGAMFRRSASRI